MAESTESSIVVNAPAAHVLDVIADLARYPEWAGDVKKVEILADKKCVNPVDTIQQRDALDTITRNLTKKERLIILMYYYEGLTMREIGEIMPSAYQSDVAAELRQYINDGGASRMTDLPNLPKGEEDDSL